jgi:cytochrome c biogenesis protein CcmG, thiol:disulfide interchange protein DsbE
MTNRQQWTIVTGLVMTGIFAVTLALKLRTEIDIIAVGSRAPNFHAVSLSSNQPATMADYRGKVLLLNIWATWCEPCRVEMPAIQRLTRKFAGTDFRLVSVSIDKDDSTVVNRFARELGLTFEILQDRSGAIQQAYQTTGFPETFVIDRDGTIVKKVIGPAEWDSPVNETLLRRLVDAR